MNSDFCWRHSRRDYMPFEIASKVETSWVKTSLSADEISPGLIVFLLLAQSIKNDSKIRFLCRSRFYHCWCFGFFRWAAQLSLRIRGESVWDDVHVRNSRVSGTFRKLHASEAIDGDRKTKMFFSLTGSSASSEYQEALPWLSVVFVRRRCLCQTGQVRCVALSFTLAHS